MLNLYILSLDQQDVGCNLLESVLLSELEEFWPKVTNSDDGEVGVLILSPINHIPINQPLAALKLLLTLVTSDAFLKGVSAPLLSPLDPTPFTPTLAALT